VDGAAGDGHVAGAVVAAGAIEQHVGRRGPAGADVVLDVAAGDLDVADVALAADDAAAGVVADVAAGDVRLVQVDVVVVDAGAAVLVQVPTVDDAAAVAPRPVDAVQRLADDQAGDGRLRGAGGLDAARSRVGADDLQALDRRGALAAPDVVLARFRPRRAGVRADEPERRPGAGHDDA